MYINRIYVNHIALAWSLADSVSARRDALETPSHGPARWRAQSTTWTASLGGEPLARLLRWLRKPARSEGVAPDAGEQSAQVMPARDAHPPIRPILGRAREPVASPRVAGNGPYLMAGFE